MKPSVYLETTIIGYLASRQSNDLVTAANQRLTHDWWDTHRHRYDLYLSQAVIAECSAGDPQAAKERLDLLASIAILEVSEAAKRLAERVVKHVPLLQREKIDALHIAVATAHGIDYLLTWNCTHIANAVLLHRIEAACRSVGFDPPTICTPQQLMGV